MNCPVCEGVSLVMSERSGIEIDYCPKCRGVWLDRGELDKIIERSAATTPVAQPVAPQPVAPQPAAYSAPVQQPSRLQDMFQRPHDGGYYKKKKREGFLSELFDFD